MNYLKEGEKFLLLQVSGGRSLPGVEGRITHGLEIADG
jgi:hypothetical protein